MMKLVLKITCIASLIIAKNIRSEQIFFKVNAKNNALKLECSLSTVVDLPKKAKAVVMIVHGSGAINKDGAMGPYSTYKDISEDLFKSQIATIRYDKRSSIDACRKGLDSPKIRHTLFISDAKEVLKQSLKRKELKKLPLFLLGHSQGVNFVNVIAANNSRISGQILIAGLAKHSIEKTLIMQLERQMQTPSYSKTQKKQLAQLIKSGTEFFEKIRSNKAIPQERFMGAYAGFWKDYIQFTKHAAIKAEQADVPTLVLQGEDDKNVTKEDFITHAQIAALRKKSQSHYLKNVTHLLTDTGKTRVSNKVTNPIVNWVLKIIK